MSGPQLFWRAVLCNALVCLALWMASRSRSDTAKLALVWWPLLAFIGAGFEHSIANVTTFSLAALDGTIGWSSLARNLVWTVPGNIVGGGMVDRARVRVDRRSPRRGHGDGHADGDERHDGRRRHGLNVQTELRPANAGACTRTRDDARCGCPRRGGRA